MIGLRRGSASCAAVRWTAGSCGPFPGFGRCASTTFATARRASSCSQGVPLVVVQRMLRHKDPKLTERVYGHLTPGFLRAEVDRLRFLPVVQELPPDEVHALAARDESLGPSLVQAAEEGREGARPTEANPVAAWALGEARSTGLEPVTSGVTGRRSNQLN
jgi:hypothetical protein